MLGLCKGGHILLNYKLGTLELPDSRFSSPLATVGLHVLLVVYIGLECFLAVGTHERSLLLVHSHMSPYTAGGGEHHTTFPTLEHSLARVRPQVVVQTATGDELLATHVAHEGSLARVTSRVLL